MQSTAHARHNIFSAEPINNEKKKASRKDVKRVSFVDSMPTTPSTPQDSPPQHIGKLTKSPSNMSSSLPDIDFDVRKKLAVKDLSVKFVHKSPTFNVATTMGVKSPSTKLQSTEDRVNNILNDMFALDDDADLNSISKASLASMHSQGVASQGPPPSQPSQRSTAAGKPTFSSSQSLSYSHTAKSNKYSVKIMPNSYFFGDNHSVVEVDDDDYESTVAASKYQEDEDGHVIQPHPKAFQSPMDAHRSFMAASKSKQTLRSIKSLSNAKSIPSDLISQEAKKAIVSMKIASKKVSRGFGSQKSLNSDAASSPSNSGKFFFLTNLSQERYPSPPTIREEEEEWEVDDDDDDGHGDSPSRSTRMISTKHDNVQGHRAPLESTKAVIVERPLLHSTFSRFKPNMALSTVDGENHATLLRSMDRQKQAMKENDKHLFGNDNEDFGEQDEQLLDQVVRGSLHHIPKLNFLESGRNILKSVDSIIAKWTMLPKPEKPRTPPPVEPEPMTAVSLFGEHLLRAEKVKDIPEDELQRLLNTPIEKRIYSNHRDYKPPPAKSPARREEMVSGSTRASAKSDRDDMAYFGAISSAIESSPSRPAPSALPPLDLTPITAASAANSVPPKIASPHFPPLHQPSTHNAAPSAQKILSTEPKTPTLPHQRGARDGAELFSPQFTTDQSNMMSYLSFLSPQSKSFLENFLENSDKPSGDQNPFLSPPPLYPQPLSHSNQGYSYQHSTTSYQPTDYINRSALGFDYHAPSAEKGRELNRKKSRDDVVFSERHLGNIQRHSVLAGQAEPVIYLPEDLDTANAAQQLVEEVVEEENGDVTIYKVPSHGASLLKLTDVLRPGAVLANQSFRQAENRLQQPHRTTSSLHYDYAQSLGLDSQVAMENIFDAEGDDDSYQGEKGHELDERNELFEGVEGGHSSVWEDYVSFLDTHNPELGLSATMAGSVASAGGAATVTTQSSPPPKPVYQPLPAISASPRSLDTPDSFVQQRALASQNAEHQASGLDLRDEILAFLQHSKSSLKEEYANYFTATAPAIPNDTVNKYAGSTIGFDDASTLASTDDEPKPSKFQFDEMKDASPEQSRLKLKAKLEDRYTRDLEGEYQMQRKVQAYLREGVRTQTQIRSKYEMDDGMLDEW